MSFLFFFFFFLLSGAISKQFDFVFLLRLRYVNKISTLAEIILMQHNHIDMTGISHLEAILEGKTNHRVLLMLDDYDEYTPGTNKDIDRAIRSGVGTCFVILTSRTGDYLKRSLRSTTDGEIIIEGFSEKNIVKCSTQYLGSRDKCLAMLKQATEAGISGLLHIPIVLLMVCAVFMEKNSLPKTKTGIVKIIIELIIDRTPLKTFGLRAPELEHLETWLEILGKLSWEALQRDIGQMLLNKVQTYSKTNLEILKSIFRSFIYLLCKTQCQ